MDERRFEKQLDALPQKPGVYLFRDASGNVLYVGKAANLRNRVRSYFSTVEDLPPKQKRLQSHIGDFEFIVTDSDQEALILECNLIKKHRPRYNVRLKDDKTYPYLKIDLYNDWPRVYVTRRVERDGSRYFGPYASAQSVRRTLNLLKQLFPFRSCKKVITGNERRPCLEYYIHRCCGPCVGDIGREEYRAVIDQVIMFLDGKRESVLRDLRVEMAAAAGRLDYERAAVLRDQIHSVEMVTESQKISSSDRIDQDVIALARSRDQAFVEVFFIRNGKLVERDNFIVQGAQDEEQGRIMAGFLNQFYSSASYIPPLILLQHMPDDFFVIEEWLSDRRGARVRLHVPFHGEKRKLVDMVAENACHGLEQFAVKRAADSDRTAIALEGLTETLHLSQQPRRIECYDISDVQGTSAVGSMVVFEDGQPRKDHYRRFRIKTVEGSDDYAMMQEVLRRRFSRINKAEGAWAIVPELVLIDGGKGHLSAAMDAMLDMEVNYIPVAAIAKGDEELFRSGIGGPIVLPRDSEALHLIQRIRDEAHRFAVGYHRKVRSRESMRSALDSIAGIGPKRKKALLRKFGSVKGIRDAEIDEIAAVPGMTRSLAEKLKGGL
ncbi:MAG: excinuclease ABC subunit UvrC [Chloroflexota bacterium]|nr:excinuclease ABC subunit UvrC [Chloroflexota bacterium]